MKKLNTLIAAGFTLIIIGLVIKCVELNKEIKEEKNRVDQLSIENIKLTEENEHLWNNYYENVSNYDGEYYE